MAVPKAIVYDENYPSRRLLDLIGDKWKPIVIYLLGQGTQRHGELQRRLPDVSKKMLTQTLRRLEDAGLLTRKIFAEVPPRVEYDLTDLGRVFLEPVEALCDWAGKHFKELKQVDVNRSRSRGSQSVDET
jgi:DNA-binding HxlR family transcriptional regulator